MCNDKFNLRLSRCMLRGGSCATQLIAQIMDHWTLLIDMGDNIHGMFYFLNVFDAMHHHSLLLKMR